MLRQAVGSRERLISGATMLVRDGKAYADPTGQPPGGANPSRNPETAIGLGADGKHAIFVAIDGHGGDAGAVGVTPAEATGYLLAHHVDTAILFDGGGSTTLAGRKPGDTALSVLNTPSDATAERKVANGIFVYTTEKQAGPARHVVINNGQPVSTVPGGTIALPVYARDALDNPLAAGTDVTVSPASLASYAGGKLTVHRTGVGVISARNGSATSSQPLRVVDRLQSLAISPTAPDLGNGATQQFGLTGTATGFAGGATEIPNESAHWRVSPASLGTVDEHGLFTAAASGGGMASVTADVGGKSASASVAVGSATLLLDRADDSTTWKLRDTTGRGATFSTASGVVPPGSTSTASLQLTYSMPGKSGVKQLVLSKPGIATTTDDQGRNPTGFGVWVNGDGSGIDTAVNFIGADGKSETIYPGQVTWQGWQRLDTTIPADLQFPVRIGFVDFLGINPDHDLGGTLNVSDLQALYSPRPVVTTPYVAIPNNPAWLQFAESASAFGPGGTTLLTGDDAHLLADDPGSASSNVLAAIAKRIPTLPAAAHPASAQMLGDMSDNGDLINVQYARDKIAAFGIPYRDAVGNHEISQGAVSEKTNFAQVFGDTHYAYNQGPARIIVTDSAHGGLLSSNSEQVPDEEQYAWLAAQLSETRARAIVVVTHMPAYDPHAAADSQFGNRWEAREYVRLIQRFEQTHPGQHVVMLYGHARGFSEQVLDPDGRPTDVAHGGVPQLTFADLGMPAYAPADQGGFYHFGLLHVTAAGDFQFSVEPVLSALTVSAPESLAVRAHGTATATGTNVGGDNQPQVTVPIADPASHVWASNQPNVVSVDARTGVLTAHRPGSATISVTSGGITATATVRVTG